MRTRAISAAVLVPVAVACLLVGGWAWIALVLAASLGLAMEWAGLTRGRPSLGLRLLGVPYVVLPALSLLWLRADGPAGLRHVLFLLLIVWASDIGAYVAGRLFGGPRLAPAISPGKTWSGALGGLVAAMAVGLCMAGDGEGFLRVLAVAGGLSVVAQAGDLMESRLKRTLGVKDSGRLIPGHGGLFDRLDGLLAAAPVAAVLAILAGPGVEFWR